MLESLKKDVVAMAKRAQKEGLCKHLSGNLSARDPETGYVVITPTQVDRDLLTARDMVVLDLDANVIENESGLRPTSESLMHLQIYKTRPDVNAICQILYFHLPVSSLQKFLHEDQDPVRMRKLHLISHGKL